MSVTIDNGRRVAVEAPDFSGMAGLAMTRFGEQIAYRPNKDGRVAKGQSILIDGQARIVAAAADSDFAAKFRVLTLAAVTAGPHAP